MDTDEEPHRLSSEQLLLMHKLKKLLLDFWREECGAWFVTLLIAIALQVVAYLLAPKPKKAQPEETKDFENPVADAGMPIPVVFGTVTVKGLNILWFGDKDHDTFSVEA